MTTSCATCRFSNRLDQDNLACHHGPPTAAVVVLPVRTLQGDGFRPTPISAWPIVRPEEWCGKFEPHIFLSN